MLRFSIIVAFILHSYAVNSVDICAADSLCLCREYSEDNQDYVGDAVDCSYYSGKPDILTADFTLPSVTYSLDLSSSNITLVQPSKVLQSSTLVQLFMRNNLIKEIPKKVLRLPELKWLDLSYNQLEFIDKEVFTDIRKLEYLNLANNRFVTYEKLSFHHLSNLNELVLDNNDLGSSLEEANLFDRSGFGLTHKIKSLSISGVNLKEVPDNFFLETYDIRRVVISKNYIKDIFELPITLEYLDLSDNPIEEISSEDFVDLPAIKVLKLNNLLIKEVPEYVFMSLHSLIELELERNRNLTEFSSLAFGQEVLDDAEDFLLEKLSLRGSRLTKLDEELSEPIGRLRWLDLQGNPWKCDCELVWLKSLQIQPEDYEHFRCGAPKPLFNSKIFELDTKYFKCIDQRLTDHHVGLAVAAAAFCILLAGIALWFFVFIPKYQSRGNCLSHLHTPGAAYSILPVHSYRTEL